MPMRIFRRRRGVLRGSRDAHGPDSEPCRADEVRAARERLSEQEQTVVGLLAWARRSRAENDYAGRMRAAYLAEPRGNRA